MHRSLRVSLLLAALVLTVAQPGLAQQRGRRGIVEVTGPRSIRHGLWLGLGAGVGSESYRFEDQNSYTEGLEKPVIALRIGGTPNPHVRVGGEMMAWIDDQGNATESLTSFLLTTQLYPSRTAGLFVKGGLGFGRVGLDFDDGFSSSDVGFAWTVGAGWEIPLSRSIFLTPTVDVVLHQYDRRFEPDFRERLVHAGFAITIQP